jgi:hypothetical protein
MSVFIIDYLCGMVLTLGLGVSFDNMQGTGKGYRRKGQLTVRKLIREVMGHPTQFKMSVALVCVRMRARNL